MSRWRGSVIIIITWCLLALGSLIPVTNLLQSSFPLFTVLWILPPLIVVVVSGDSQRVGFRAVRPGELARVAVINLGGLLLLMLLVEPWSHTYAMLLQAAMGGSRPDPTFAWLVRYPGFSGLAGMFLFSGLVTLYGEELFFRGWLLQSFQKRLGKSWAVALQAGLYVLPNLLVTIALPPLQAVLFRIQEDRV